MKTKLWWKWQYVPSTSCVLLNVLYTIPFLPLRAFSLSSHLNVPILTTLVVSPWTSFFWGTCLREFTRAALTKQYILSGLNSSNLYFPSSGSWKSMIKESAGLLSSAASLLSLLVAVSPYVFACSSLCARVSFSFLLKGYQSYWIRAHSNYFS